MKERRSIRFSNEEWDAVKKVAASEGRNPSNFVWWVVMQYVKKALRLK